MAEIRLMSQYCFAHVDMSLFKDILDLLRFTLEAEDARINHSQFSREFDTRDINYAEPIQAYLELFFKETPLGKDDLGNHRQISIKAGRQAFEYTDRRLLARNEWRNAPTTFKGFVPQLAKVKTTGNSTG